MTCRVVQTAKGNVARVNCSPNMSPESQEALEVVIDAATEQFLDQHHPAPSETLTQKETE